MARWLMLLVLSAGLFGCSSEKADEPVSKEPKTEQKEESEIDKTIAMKLYLDKVNPLITDAKEVMDSVKTILEDVYAYPEMVTSEGWRQDIVDEYTKLEEIYAEFKSISPPEEAERFHQLFGESLELNIEAGKRLVVGLQLMNSDILEESADLMQQANKKADEAAQEADLVFPK